MMVDSVPWHIIQKEMEHVAQFRDLNEQDWDNLCSAIEAEVLKSHKESLQKCRVRREDLNRRKDDRRKDDRRDYSKLDNVSEDDWDALCDRIYELTMGQRSTDERQSKDRRRGDRRWT